MSEHDDGTARPALTCAVCGDPLISMGDDVRRTLVGYARGECGSPHDDNCVTRSAWCRAGHRTTISIRRSCESCSWRGKDRCRPYCHDGLKLDAWPGLPVGQAPVLTEARSAISGTLVAPCLTCGAAGGELCRDPDGTYVQYKGHLGAHLARLQDTRSWRAR